MAGLYGDAGIAGFNSIAVGNSQGNIDMQSSNYAWKSSSYALKNEDKNVIVNANLDGIEITLPNISDAKDGQFHFIGNWNESTKSIIVIADCNIEDNANSTNLEPGTGYEFVLNKQSQRWVPFSR